MNRNRLFERSILILLCMLLCFFLTAAFLICDQTNDVVMGTAPLSSDAIYYGMLSIPNAGIETELWRFHDGDICCLFGLFNGGKIIANTENNWDSIRVGDIAFIYPDDDAKNVVECIEIIDCIVLGDKLIGFHGINHADGDILLVDIQCQPIVTVYRWTLL